MHHVKQLQDQVSITIYIEAGRWLVPRNWQHHPILGASHCRITNLRGSRRALVIELIRITTCRRITFTLEISNKLIAGLIEAKLTYMQNKAKCLTFELLFRFGCLMGLLVPWAESESWTFNLSPHKHTDFYFYHKFISNFQMSQHSLIKRYKLKEK